MNSGCVICQDPFDAAIGIVTTKCGHVFHNICIDQWLERAGTCPECRSNVRKSNLTKLYFNTSFDDTSGDSGDRSLDTLKEQLRAKDVEIMNRDVKIKELQTFCAISESRQNEMHQEILELNNQMSVVKIDIQKLRRVEAINQKLVQENTTLQGELEHLNNVKTIVEGCCNDAKQILTDMQVHISTAEGKAATHRIATYCSVIKRELTCSMEEKTQLQNELTKVKRKMGILQAGYAKKISQLEKQVKRLEDLNSSFLSTTCGPSPIAGDALKNRPPQSNNLANTPTASCASQSCENEITPITLDFPENKRQKLNIVVVDKEIAKFSTEQTRTPVLRLANPTLPARRDAEKDSVSRIGYNGLGGHGRIVMGSGAKWVKRKPLK